MNVCRTGVLQLSGSVDGSKLLPIQSTSRTVMASNTTAEDSSYASLPVLTTFTTVMSSNTTSWDATAIATPYILFDPQAGLYKMWYQAMSDPVYVPPYYVYRYVIACAESTYDMTWTNKTIVQDTGSGTYYITGAPCVLEENGTYVMWHMGWYEWVGADWSAYIARMSSSDGVNWPAFQSPGDQNVLSAQGQTNPQGDGRSASEPWIIHTPGQGYTMWYSVYDYPATGTVGPQKIWTATSADGVSWVNRQLSLPYVPGSWEANVAHPSVVKEDDGTYTMYYAAAFANGSSSIGVARSLDGISWTNRTQLLKPSDLGANITSVSDPSYFQDVDGKRYLYFTYYDGQTKFGRVQLSSGPVPKLIDPDENATVIGDTELYATDRVDVMVITSATFEYSKGGSQWILIGTDTNGTTEVMSENCTAYDIGLWNVTWSTGALTEGSYYVRVTMTDIWGRTGQDVVSLYVDPTPPIPTITGITDGQSVKGVVKAIVTTDDENVNATMAQIRAAGYGPSPTPSELGVPLLDQHHYGPQSLQQDLDEWKDNHYCAPTAGASVIEYWAKQLPDLMKNPKTGAPISEEELVGWLARFAGTKELPDKPPGTKSLLHLKWALEIWIGSHGGGLIVSPLMHLNFHNFKTELEIGEVPIVSTGRHTLVANSVDNEPNKYTGSYFVDFMDPWTGQIYYTSMMPDGTFYYDDQGWVSPLDPRVAMFSVSMSPGLAPVDTPPVPQLPEDWSPWKSLPCIYENNAWTLEWNTSLVAQNEYYLIRVSMMDTDGRSGYSVVWVFVAHPRLIGDINGDGIVDILDAITLAGAYGTQEGQTRYNADANLNTNPDPVTGLQVIDILDAITLANNFNKHYP